MPSALGEVGNEVLHVTAPHLIDSDDAFGLEPGGQLLDRLPIGPLRPDGEIAGPEAAQPRGGRVVDWGAHGALVIHCPDGVLVPSKGTFPAQRPR
jgi:hypothetical protein